MTVDYQLEPSDLIAFSEEQRHFIPKLPSQVYYWGVFPLLFVGLAVVVESFSVAAAFAGLFLLAGWFTSDYTRRAYRRAAFSEDNLSLQLLPRRVSLSEDGVSFSCDASVFVYRWRFVREVVRGSRYLCFVLTPLERIHVPIRAFRDTDHLEQFIRTAQAHLKVHAA